MKITILILLLASIIVSSANIGPSRFVSGRNDKTFVPDLPGRTNRIETRSRQVRSFTFDPKDLKTPPRIVNRRGKTVRRTSP
ncbi:hypothetical protein GCK72_013480 [Caenorhabditis remanei]|uniref:Uncharacterized protein n=1 Tax=Caenorhabditis remanei TaxID=31234 RepID=A0A6A5GR67_CAERE|nr:hypothetical protein GCK72_013480 [Caenorhabditis remanei]KAF1757025.1 hypothetical protein GCK72_013480 [Caenorhabditis remanei]